MKKEKNAFLEKADFYLTFSICAWVELLNTFSLKMSHFFYDGENIAVTLHGTVL